jgi:predicted AlkP superfamily pyrophosphatase or phosphodiesterase
VTERRPRVVVVLIDGLGSAFFVRHRRHMPALERLAQRALVVGRVKPPLPATSRPGRATLLTGLDTAAHGIYGNNIFDGERFRHATAADIRSPTLARMAREAGLAVAGVGFAMLAPEDTALCLGSWWEHKPVAGATNLKIPAVRLGELVVLKGDSSMIGNHLGTQPFTQSRGSTLDGTLHPHMVALASDQRHMTLAGALAVAEDGPDLIFTEISITDSIQHYHGTDSGAALWAYGAADLMLGRLVTQIERADGFERTLLIVTSDHGHAPIHTALYPAALVPEHPWATEGASLHVRVDAGSQREAVAERLSRHGITRFDDTHLPRDRRELIATFAAPPGFAFEPYPDNGSPASPSGSPVVISTHGLAPGSDTDDYPCFVVGPGVASKTLAAGRGTQLAPTIARHLGLSLAAFDGDPIA